MPPRRPHNSAIKYTIIKEPTDSRISPYRSLKGKMLEKDGIFLAEGEKVVRSMVESRHRVVSCLVTSEAIVRYRPLITVMKKRGACVYVADDKLVENIIGFRFHRGIMAIGCCPEKLGISKMLNTSKRPLLLAALNAVNDPENVGLIVRNAAAFDAQALIVDNATYDPYYRKAVRVSMGTIFTLPVYYEDDLASSLMFLKKKHNTRIIVATPDKAAEDIAKTNLSGNICLVFGNEDKGASRRVLRVADVKVRIPISKTVDSLNVASASAVFMYAASRQGRASHIV